MTEVEDRPTAGDATPSSSDPQGSTAGQAGDSSASDAPSAESSTAGGADLDALPKNGPAGAYMSTAGSPPPPAGVYRGPDPERAVAVTPPTRYNYPMVGKLADDEPIFILRGRDALTPEVIRYWAARLVQEGGSTAKAEQAVKIAESIRAWQSLFGVKLPD